MVVKVYISGISGNKEVKKRQQRVLMILDSKNVDYQVIDITEPGKEEEKEFMQTNGTARDSKYPLPPQIFNEDDYCGDYEAFDLANEIDELEIFLKTTGVDSSSDPIIDKDNSQSNSHVKQNGNTSSREASTDKDVSNVETELDDQQNSTVDNPVDDDGEEDNAEQTKSINEDEDEDEDELTTKKTSNSDAIKDNGEKNKGNSEDREKEE